MYLKHLSWLDLFILYFSFCSQESVYLMPCRGKNHLVYQHTEFHYVTTLPFMD